MINELTPFEWALLPLKKYATFKGRAPRAEYWWFYLGTFIVSAVLKALDALAGTGDAIGNVGSIALLLPWIAVTVRRLHDTERSGWWILGLAVGVVAFIALFVGLGLFGQGSTAAAFTTGMVAILIILAAAITLLVFMVLPGTEGPNRYGPDPYGRHDELEEVFA
jgi:uncharacterized membrane protein YhaH (DUF805 family)